MNILKLLLLHNRFVGKVLCSNFLIEFMKFTVFFDYSFHNTKTFMTKFRLQLRVKLLSRHILTFSEYIKNDLTVSIMLLEQFPDFPHYATLWTVGREYRDDSSRNYLDKNPLNSFVSLFKWEGSWVFSMYCVSKRSWICLVRH